MNFLSKYTSGLRGKLLLTALIPLIGFTMLSAIGYLAAKDLKDVSSTAYTEFIPNSQNLGDLNESSTAMAYNMWMAYGSFDDEKRQADAIKNATAALDKYSNTFEAYSGADKLEGEKADYEIVATNNDEFIGHSKNIISLLAKNSPDSREAAIKEMTSGPWSKQMYDNRAAYERILSFYKTQSEADKAKVDSIAKKSNMLLFWGGTIAAFVTLALMIFMSNRITNTVINSSLKLEDLGQRVNDAITQLASAGQGLS